MIGRRAMPASLVLAAALLAGACAPAAAPPAVPTGAPRFPAFSYPAPPAGLEALPDAVNRHRLGWEWLQVGEFRTAERNFTTVLKEAPSFYPAHAGLGYLALAQEQYAEAVAHFGSALAADAAYVPALLGRAEAQLALGDNDQALETLEAAVAADPSLTSVRSRIEVLRFRGLQEEVDAARQAAAAGRLAEARTAYNEAIAASPESPFLYRELADVERRAGNTAAALVHAERASELDPADPRALVMMAEMYEAQGDYTRAADTYTAAAALEPNDAVDRKIEELRERAAFEAMPEEYKSIETAPTITRAQLAALFGVRLDDLLRRAGRRAAVVITDTRNNWAAPWILSVARAGVMEVYSNHTFQPAAIVRRGDLAAAASRALGLVAAENPRLAAEWRNARRRFPDLSPGHLSYPHAARAVDAGVMATLPDGSFQLSRPVTGAEALAAVRAIEALAGSPPQ